MAPTLEASFGQQSNMKQQQPIVAPSTIQQQQQQQQQQVCNNGNNKSAFKTGTIKSKFDENEDTQNVNPFQLMLQRIEGAFSRSDSSVDVDELWRVLEDYKSNNTDWARYAYYDTNKQYKRNLVAEFEKFNVMILCWGPGSKSCIHDHSGSHCFMKVIDGELVESRFAWPDKSTLVGARTQEMCRLSDNRLDLNDVLYINDKVGLHLVENPNPNKTAASLHVYIPPYRKCKAFDQRTGQARDCSLNFYSKCGRVINEEENC